MNHLGNYEKNLHVTHTTRLDGMAREYKNGPVSIVIDVNMVRSSRGEGGTFVYGAVIDEQDEV